MGKQSGVLEEEVVYFRFFGGGVWAHGNMYQNAELQMCRRCFSQTFSHNVVPLNLFNCLCSFHLNNIAPLLKHFW